jgi:CrcB protein
MRNILLVGAGGFLGAIARYGVSGLVIHSSGASRFPLGTLVVNVTGCLAIGVLAALTESTTLLTPGSRLLLRTGVLGGYTTFSAFAFESYALGRGPGLTWVAVNIGAQVTLGIVAVILGHKVTMLVLT